MRVPTHDPQAAVGFEKQAVRSPCGNGCDAPVHNLLGLVGEEIAIVSSAVAQLAILIVTHRPETPVRFEKQAVFTSCGDRDDAAVHNLLGAVGVPVPALAPLSIKGVVTHSPQAGVALQKQTMI